MPIDSVPCMTPILQSLLCEGGETVNVERHSYSRRPGETSYSATYFCTNNEEVQRDVTGRAIMIGIAVFVVPFLIGLFMIIGGSIGMAGKAASAAVGGATSTIMTMSADSARVNRNGFGPPVGKDSITERLKALKNAYDQGLITEAEYESKRQQILGEI